MDYSCGSITDISIDCGNNAHNCALSSPFLQNKAILSQKEQDIIRLNNQLLEQEENIYQLETERNAYMEKVFKLTETVQQMNDLLKKKDTELNDIRDELYLQNNASQALVNCREELGNIKHKYKAVQEKLLISQSANIKLKNECEDLQRQIRRAQILKAINLNDDRWKNRYDLMLNVLSRAESAVDKVITSSSQTTESISHKNSTRLATPKKFSSQGDDLHLLDHIQVSEAENLGAALAAHELKVARDRIRTLETQIEFMQTDSLFPLEQKLAEKTATCDALNNRLSESTRAGDDLLAQLGQMSCELDRLRHNQLDQEEQNALLKEKLLALTRQAQQQEELQFQLEATKSQQHEVIGKVVRLEYENIELKQHLEYLRMKPPRSASSGLDLYRLGSSSCANSVLFDSNNYHQNSALEEALQSTKISEDAPPVQEPLSNASESALTLNEVTASTPQNWPPYAKSATYIDQADTGATVAKTQAQRHARYARAILQPQEEEMYTFVADASDQAYISTNNAVPRAKSTKLSMSLENLKVLPSNLRYASQKFQPEQIRDALKKIARSQHQCKRSAVMVVPDTQESTEDKCALGGSQSADETDLAVSPRKKHKQSSNIWSKLKRSGVLKFREH